MNAPRFLCVQWDLTKCTPGPLGVHRVGGASGCYAQIIFLVCGNCVQPLASGEPTSFWAPCREGYGSPSEGAWAFPLPGGEAWVPEEGVGLINGKGTNGSLRWATKNVKAREAAWRRVEGVPQRNLQHFALGGRS